MSKGAIKEDVLCNRYFFTAKTTLQFSKMCFGESCVDDRSTKEGAVALARDGESYFGRAES
jgi:hypothetical protein